MSFFSKHLRSKLGRSNAQNLMAKFAMLFIVLFWLGWAFYFSKFASINIPTFHLDGSFQTASGLFRLDAGQFPGRDFYPYLGVGPVFMLFPIFKMSGANISASVFAAQLAILMLGCFSAAFLWHMIWRPKSYLTSLAAGGLVFLMTVVVTKYLGLPALDSSPGNSLRAIRAAAPYLAVVIYYFWVQPIVTPWRYLRAGCLAAFVLLWSNDFAIPTAGLLSLYIAVQAMRRGEFKLSNAIVYIVVALFVWLTLMEFATRGHVLALLQYNFLDVAHDQWWFFGPYGEANRVFNLGQLYKLISPETYFPLIALTGMAAICARTRSIECSLLLLVGVMLLAGGALASLGGHMGGYFGGFYLWSLMLSMVMLLRALVLFLQKVLDGWPNLTGGWALAAGILIVLMCNASLFFWQAHQLRSAEIAAKKDTARFYVPELGGYLSVGWKAYIESARQYKGGSVMEEYWGIWSAMRRSFPSWPVDSVIHALGSIRAIASANLPRADMVISTRYEASPNWQPWSLTQNYWFYQTLLEGWVPSVSSPTTVIWHRVVHPRVLQSVDCRIDQNGSSLILVAPHAGFYDIDLKYAFSGVRRSIVLVKNYISYGLDAGGYASVDPRGTNAQFPVYVKRAGPVVLGVKITPRADLAFSAKSCTARYIPMENGDVLHVPSETTSE